MSDKSRELMERPSVDAWAACASIWSRVFVLSRSGWDRDPELFETMRTAFSLAMQRSAGVGDGSGPFAERLLSAFAAFGLEDDGSAEWNYMLDLIGMITPVLSDQDVSTCLDAALRFYLDGAFNMRARAYAVADGRPIPVAEVGRRIADDPEWERAVNLITAL